MSIFRKEKSAVIQKKITGLQQELKVIEKQAVDKELQIEEAVSNGSSTDKLFEQAGQLWGNIEARRSILAKMEAEHDVALQGEQCEVKLKEITQVEQAVAARIEKLAAKQAELVSAALQVVDLSEEFNSLSAGVQSLGYNVINFHGLPFPDSGKILQAVLSAGNQFHDFGKDLTIGRSEIESNLRAC